MHTKKKRISCYIKKPITIIIIKWVKLLWASLNESVINIFYIYTLFGVSCFFSLTSHLLFLLTILFVDCYRLTTKSRYAEINEKKNSRFVDMKCEFWSDQLNSKEKQKRKNCFSLLTYYILLNFEIILKIVHNV